MRPMVTKCGCAGKTARRSGSALSEGLGITARGKIGSDWLVFQNHVVREFEDFLDQWMSKCLFSGQAPTKKLSFGPGRLSSVDNRYSKPVVLVTKLQGNGNAFRCAGAFTPLSSTNCQADSSLWVVVREGREVHGVRVAIFVHKPRE